MPKAVPSSPLSPASRQMSGLPCLKMTAWRRAAPLFRDMDSVMDVFLEQWTVYMQAAGYLVFTTARRADCIAACRSLTDHIVRHLDTGYLPTFERLAGNSDNWAQDLVASGLRHMRRGITGTMYLGCFKTFIHALEDAVHAFSFGRRRSQHVLDDACVLLRLYGAAFEEIWMDVCLGVQRDEHHSDMDEMLRRLTLEKCRFENVFNTTSDGVLVMDAQCRVTTANRSLRQYAGENLTGRAVWDVLGLESSSPEEFFRYYPVGQTVEVTPFGGDLVFRLSISSLGDISLASSGEYLVLLTNITPHVTQREIMEEVIRARTAALEKEKRQIEEMNITLRTVLNNVAAERDQSRAELASSLQNFLAPALARLVNIPDKAARHSHAALIEDQVRRMLGQAGGSPDSGEQGMARLTLAELNVCRFIRAGHSTKEIAAALGISPETVQTHRKNIRRKLGVRGQDAQLAAFLAAHPFHGDETPSRDNG